MTKNERSTQDNSLHVGGLNREEVRMTPPFTKADASPTSNQRVLHICHTPCSICENARLRAALEKIPIARTLDEAQKIAREAYQGSSVETPAKRFDPESLAAEAEEFLAQHWDLSDAGLQFRRALQLIREMLACARGPGPAPETSAEPTADQLRAAEFAEALRLECAKAEPGPGRGLLNMIEGLLSRYAGAQAFERRAENALVLGGRIEDPTPGPFATDGVPQP